MKDDAISRRGAIKAIKDALLSWSNMPEWRENKIVGALDKLPSAQRWIPCSEQLPKRRKFYFVTACGVVEYAYYNSEGMWFSSSCDELEGITAWMPLPEPWKGEDDE